MISPLFAHLAAADSATSDNFASFDVPAWAWVALVGAIVVMLVFDLLLVHRTAHVITIKEAAIESAIWISIGLAFGLVMIAWQGGQAGGEYYAGFLIEKSLSVDNVFVWAVIFSFFAVPRQYQFRVLFWGIFGALVLRAVASLPDNAKGKRPPFSREQFVADPSLMWGNHIEIDHGNGEISMLAHLKNGSVTLKVGDVVKRGQKVGEMGFSGDAFLVHLHYDLKSGPGFKADGLPSPFNDFERLNGAQWLKVKHGQVDSGDIVRRSAK